MVLELDRENDPFAEEAKEAETGATLAPGEASSPRAGTKRPRFQYPEGMRDADHESADDNEEQEACVSCSTTNRL